MEGKAAAAEDIDVTGFLKERTHKNVDRKENSPKACLCKCVDTRAVQKEHVALSLRYNRGEVELEMVGGFSVPHEIFREELSNLP